MSEMKSKINFELWSKLESLIKKYESSILILLIIMSIIWIPLKILGYGWNPTENALNHVAFSTIDAKWSDVVIIDEKYDIDHNLGWHKILKCLYKFCGFDEQDLLIFSFVGLFLLLNVCGLLVSASPISWIISLLVVLGINSSIIFRLISGRPYIFSFIVSLIILRLWSSDHLISNVFKEKPWIRECISVFILSVCIWIFGSWYVFLVIPISFFVAGDSSKAIKLFIGILSSVVLAALFTGDFVRYLNYYFLLSLPISFESASFKNVLLENSCGGINTYNLIFIGFIILLCVKKNNYKISQLFDDPSFVAAVLCWMGSILYIRFWVDWGVIFLLYWMSYRIKELIDSSESLKEPRIRYCLVLFILASFVFVSTNDAQGRFTKPVMVQAIDFYNDATLDKLQGWEPQPGGIIYSNSVDVFNYHFLQYPKIGWKYILGFNPALMKDEDKEILKNIEFYGTINEFEPWINKMTEKDRLILTRHPGTHPKLEWKRGNNNFWIGRLKNETDKNQNEKTLVENDKPNIENNNIK